MTFWNLKPQPSETTAMLDSATLKNELSHAYDRGRLHERTRRPGFGLIALLLTVLSAGFVCLAGLAASEGSFAAGGADVDRFIHQGMSQLGQ